MIHSKVEEDASWVQNVYFLKSLVKCHTIHQLGSLAKLSWIGLNQLSCLLVDSMATDLGFQIEYILNL